MNPDTHETLLAKLTNMQNFLLDKTYQVNGVPITVRHFERIAQQMNLTRFKNAPTAAWRNSPLPAHGKMPALDKLLANCYERGVETVGCFASHGSNWTLGVPVLGAVNGIARAIIVYATNPRAPFYPDWLKLAKDYGAEIIPVHPNMTAINSAQAKKIVENEGGYFIPFGLETEPVLTYLTEAMGFENNLETLVLCAGSGITLSGILLHLKKYDKRIKKIVAVSSGRPADSINETVDRIGNLYGYDDLRSQCDSFQVVGGYAYSQMIKPTAPFETHPYYERKAWHYLSEHIHEMKEPIRFLNMGI